MSDSEKLKKLSGSLMLRDGRALTMGEWGKVWGLRSKEAVYTMQFLINRSEFNVEVVKSPRSSTYQMIGICERKPKHNRKKMTVRLSELMLKNGGVRSVSEWAKLFGCTSRQASACMSSFNVSPMYDIKIRRFGSGYTYEMLSNDGIPNYHQQAKKPDKSLGKLGLWNSLLTR